MSTSDEGAALLHRSQERLEAQLERGIITLTEFVSKLHDVYDELIARGDDCPTCGAEWLPHPASGRIMEHRPLEAGGCTYWTRRQSQFL